MSDVCVKTSDKFFALVFQRFLLHFGEGIIVDGTLQPVSGISRLRRFEEEFPQSYNGPPRSHTVGLPHTLQPSNVNCCYS